MSHQWNEPANYGAGQFGQCDGTESTWHGVYNGSTFHQGQKHPLPPSLPDREATARRTRARRTVRQSLSPSTTKWPPWPPCSPELRMRHRCQLVHEDPLLSWRSGMAQWTHLLLFPSVSTSLTSQRRHRHRVHPPCYFTLLHR
ncbi:hypothetical protein K437DRAFT_160024 [Tilletiaria anomala UBC 951]|uniref:Uncharacterized protein n=1 Tax=Tilletiaria anomala (strain ATCC 24038 / CBS 436.72 / UBC 951) TaxID=1037660 RepID=A0A066VLK1_TILAU|nr:uncharacterized protein K437DRAFT_160024 [Tilletiaria anomala UBC 951]KDN42632.1 hypothetical protein K437DRAFT_160024 [Tilletiaria anomala UBC 951]